MNDLTGVTAAVEALAPASGSVPDFGVSSRFPSDSRYPAARMARCTSSRSASARCRTPTCTSMTSFASRPGTAVDPTCETSVATPVGARAAPIRATTRSPRRPQSGRGSTTAPRAGPRVRAPSRRFAAYGSRRSRQRRSTCARSSAGLPPLSTSTSATTRRSASVAWVATLARASASARPRWCTSRCTRVSASTSMTTARCSCTHRPRSTSSGMSKTETAPEGVAARSSVTRAVIAGVVIASRARNASGSAKTIAARAARSNVPSARTTASPKRSRTRVRAALPGSTTSRATASASTTWAPSRCSCADTLDLPEPMPPVTPTRSTSQRSTSRAGNPPRAIGPQRVGVTRSNDLPWSRIA